MIDEDDGYDEDSGVEIDGEYIVSNGLTSAEESIVQSFLQSERSENRNLADIIMEKIMQRNDRIDEDSIQEINTIPPKVASVYSAVGKILQHYKSGKLPKALKMLPHLKNWEVNIFILE